MVLVPAQVMEDLQQWKQEQLHKPRLPPNPQVAMTSKLHKEMQNTLDRVDLSESEKSQLYGEKLHQFQTAHCKVFTASPKSVTKSNTKAPMHERILESVPKTMRRKIQLLLDLLSDHSNMLWDDHGTLMIHGKPVEGTHIIDLVNDIIRQRKHFDPQGWQLFSKGLKEVNIPQDVVGHRKRWNWMHRTNIEDTDSDEEQPSSPVRKVVSKLSYTPARKMTVKKPGSTKRVLITPSTLKKRTPKWEPY